MPPHPDLRRHLAARWPLPGNDELRDALLEAWSSPDRGYHDLEHLTEVLDRLAELADGVPHAELEVHLAAWFHDAVYDGEPDPEARSAEWARRALPRTRTDGGPPVDVDEVARLVLLTREHSPAPEDANGVALCDADLAVLASPAERYREYVAGVRHEYAHLDDATFTAGRIEVLRTFLARDHVFTSATARLRWEPAARHNAAREIEELSSRVTSARATSARAAWDGEDPSP